MAFDLTSIGASALQWVINPLIWFLILVLMLVVLYMFLAFKKKKILRFPTIEIVDLGEGRLSMNSLKSGWFGSKWMFGGLWTTGDKELKISTGETIYYFATSDYQEVDNQRGVICFRNPLQQNILVPISQIKLDAEGRALLAKIAPADYRDVAVDIFRETVKETGDWKEKLLLFGSIALVVIFALISIIIIAQMVKSGQDKASELLLSAGEKGAEACKEICNQAVQYACKLTGNAP